MRPRKTFLLRIEPGLFAELESWAQQELRSVNGQIEYLLKQAVHKRKPSVPEPSDEEGRGLDDENSSDHRES
jgi:hypothetical protein